MLLRDSSLYVALKNLFEKYAKNWQKFCFSVSSQANETINSIMARKCPKQHCYSRSESSDYRFASSVCAKNDGDKYLVDVYNKLGMEVQHDFIQFTRQQDAKRQKKAALLKTREYKRQRKIVAKKRENLRKRKEDAEGIQYESKSGWDAGVSNILRSTI